MKRFNLSVLLGRNISRLAIATSLVICIAASGCELRKDREAEAAAEQAKQDKAQAKAESEAAAQKAKDEAAADKARQAEEARVEKEKQAAEAKAEREKQAAEAKAERDKQAAQDKAERDRQAAEAKAEAARQAEAEAKKRAAEAAAALERAKSELRNRIALYNTLTGDYDGSYVAKANAVVNIRIHVTTANVPAPAELDLMSRESDVLQRVDAIGLDIQTVEGLTVDHRYSVFCSGMNLKANFAAGMVRFDCSGQGAVTARRLYVFDFDTGDVAAMANETPETAPQISAALGNDLVAGRLAQLGGFRLSILLNPEFGSQFTGTLTRRVSHQ